MGRTNFEIVYTDDWLTSHSGLHGVGSLINVSGLRERVSDGSFSKRKGSISSADVLTAMTALLAMAKPDFSAIEPFEDDEFFQRALGLDAVPSEPTLRQRLDEIGASARKKILRSSAQLLKDAAPALSPCHADMLPLDVDVSVLDNSDTSKEGVGYTYKKTMGFAPIFAYLGEEGYMLNAELRPGTQHCQAGTPAFLEECIALARKVTDKPLLTRMDAGNDDIENIRVCRRRKVDYIIKRNLRGEDRHEWLEDAQAFGKWDEPREGKMVYTGSVHKNRDGKCLRIVFEVIERGITADGQALLVPDLEVATFTTSLSERRATAEEVIGLYKAHGTSEQFHSELKSDMDVERLPSGKFATNALVLELSVLAFNILRICGQAGLRNGHRETRKKVRRRRLRSVIQDIIYMAGRIIRHARGWKLALSRANPHRKSWRKTCAGLAELLC